MQVTYRSVFCGAPLPVSCNCPSQTLSLSIEIIDFEDDFNVSDIFLFYFGTSSILTGNLMLFGGISRKILEVNADEEQALHGIVEGKELPNIPLNFVIVVDNATYDNKQKYKPLQ